MSPIKALSSFALLLVAVVTMSGCSFLLQSGNGVYSHNQMADVFTIAPQFEMREWEAQARGADPQGKSDGVVRVHRSGSPLGWLWIDRRVEYHEGMANYNDHILVGRRPGLAGILYGETDVALYDVNTRRQFASHNSRHALFYILYWGDVIKAGETSFPLPWSMPPLSQDPTTYNYTRGSGVSLLWGVLAGGSKNGRAYCQILWIPVPLWSVGIQPENPRPRDLPTVHTPGR